MCMLVLCYNGLAGTHEICLPESCCSMSLKKKGSGSTRDSPVNCRALHRLSPVWLPPTHRYPVLTRTASRKATLNPKPYTLNPTLPYSTPQGLQQLQPGVGAANSEQLRDREDGDASGLRKSSTEASGTIRVLSSNNSNVKNKKNIIVRIVAIVVMEVLGSDKLPRHPREQGFGGAKPILDC